MKALNNEPVICTWENEMEILASVLELYPYSIIWRHSGFLLSVMMQSLHSIGADP
jgi:hypothetical protein